MKLLTPAATQEAKGQEVARDILRAEEAKSIEKDWRIRMAKAEADFALMLQGQRQRWEQEEKNHITEIAGRKKEIEKLEAQKLNSLVPFDILKEGTNDRMKEAESFVQNLHEREEKAETLLENLEDRLDDVSEKELLLSNRERTLAMREKGAEVQGENIRINSEKLSKQMEDFLIDKERMEKDIDARRSAIFLQEASLFTREEKLITREKEIASRTKRLSDERGVLDRAWKEFERLKSS